jgi:hypothetical protein
MLADTVALLSVLSKSVKQPPEAIQTALIVDTLTKLIRTGHIHFLKEAKAKRTECWICLSHMDRFRAPGA